MTYGFLPFAILPLFVSIDRLDDALVQAGRDLYASGRAAFLHVILPLTMPGIIAAALLTFIPAIGDYVTPDLLGGAQTSRPSPRSSRSLFLVRPRLAVGLGARVHPHGHHHRRHVRWRSAPADRGSREALERNRWLTAFALVVYVFLFAADRHPDHLQLQRRRGGTSSGPASP